MTTHTSEQSTSYGTYTYKALPYYDRDVDFDALARADPDFAALAGPAKLKRAWDFTDEKVVRQLTLSILKSDFGIPSLALPSDRLCPPVPVRWNYLRWIQELLDSTAPNTKTPDHDFDVLFSSDHYDPTRIVTGLDIGIGASCIYPLLACATRPKWRMLGSEIDAHSLEYARRNVEANGLAGRVRLVHVLQALEEEGRVDDGLKVDSSRKGLTILPKLLDEDEEESSSDDSDDEDLQPKHRRFTLPANTRLDFTMTNPPFYTSLADMHSSREHKTAPPSAICTGSTNEMICAGGDIGFVERLITESQAQPQLAQWFTAMLGRLSSLQQVVARLRAEGIDNFAVTCLRAGHQTRRWAVAWSFMDYRPRNDVARHGELVLGVLPAPTAQTIRVALRSAKWVGGRVREIVQGFGGEDGGQGRVRWVWKELSLCGVLLCSENVWSRAARRKRERGEGEEGAEGGSVGVQLGVKIQCRNEEVEVRWLRGRDQQLYISFCGMLKRALAEQR